jgi:response regulator of citrate/malate metabolism
VSRGESQPETADTLVIFLSALGEVSDKVSGLELGAIDYITKPIQAEEVLARVTNHLTRQHLERELRRNRDRLERELASAGDMQRFILPATLPAHPFAPSPPTTGRAVMPAATTSMRDLGDGRSASSSLTSRGTARRQPS